MVSITFHHLIVFLILGFVDSYNIANEHDAMMYLNRFGYINDEDMSADMTMSSMKPMLMEFQKMVHIKQTGVLDSETMSIMNAPRCGNLDVNETMRHSMFLNELEGKYPATERHRIRRFVISDRNYLWRKREITYKIGMFSERMRISQDVVLGEVHKAFNLWAEVTNFNFFHRPNDRAVDIELSFTSRFHIQDGTPFDGPGNALAHAFVPDPEGPSILGDVHFDDEENWTVGVSEGTNVLYVVVHELGHSLGLGHSNIQGSIMQATYKPYSSNLKLHSDDIEGLQHLYGKRQKPTVSQNGNNDKNQPDTKIPSPPSSQPKITTTTTMKPYPAGEGAPDLCKDSIIDAITTIKNGSVYAFKGTHVFKISENGEGVLPGWPRPIGKMFKGLTGSIDAAVTREKNGRTYIFQEKYYWRFDGSVMDAGYPKKIAPHFRGIPDAVDSAFESQNAIYFTKGNKIWRFDPDARPFVSDKYPIYLASWGLQALPRIDASFKAPNGDIYLFHGQLYRRLDERELKSNIGRTSSPRSSKTTWFGCSRRSQVGFRNIRQPPSIDYPSYFEHSKLNSNDYLQDLNEQESYGFSM